MVQLMTLLMKKCSRFALLLVLNLLVATSHAAEPMVSVAGSQSRVLKDIAQPAANIRYCVTCHGVDGRGNEAVRAPKLAGMSRWYLERQLLGFQAGYRGFHEQDLNGKEMRPMAELLTPQMMTQVLDWIETWPVEKPAPTITGDSQRGQQLYQGCIACHGAQGKGIDGVGGPALAGQSDWYLGTQLRNFKSGLRGTQAGDSYGQQMRSMMMLLKDDQAIDDVTSYIETL